MATKLTLYRRELSRNGYVSIVTTSDGMSYRAPLLEWERLVHEFQNNKFIEFTDLEDNDLVIICTDLSSLNRIKSGSANRYIEEDEEIELKGN